MALLARAGVVAPPVPVERLAALTGAQLRYAPFEGELSGLLFAEQHQTIIGVNSLDAKARQRFTIAHELGHLLLHAPRDLPDEHTLFIDRHFRVYARDVHSGEGTDVQEVEANTFAAELLMPAAMLSAEVQAHPFDYEDDAQIRALADRYRVSVQAMSFRLVNLGLIRSAGGG